MGFVLDTVGTFLNVLRAAWLSIDNLEKKYGCMVIVGQNVKPSDCEMNDIEFVRFLGKDEPWIDGVLMRDKAVDLNANLGFVDAERVLDHAQEIPVEFRDKFLVFTGTLVIIVLMFPSFEVEGEGDMLEPVFRPAVPCLVWDEHAENGGKWRLFFYWLDCGMGLCLRRDVYLVRCKKHF